MKGASRKVLEEAKTRMRLHVTLGSDYAIEENRDYVRKLWYNRVVSTSQYADLITFNNHLEKEFVHG